MAPEGPGYRCAGTAVVSSLHDSVAAWLAMGSAGLRLSFTCQGVGSRRLVGIDWWCRRAGSARLSRCAGDMHHLFACETRCNSFRGNTPYREFADFPNLDEVVRSDCGKSEGNGFEPAYGKGAAARAVFYFLLRYPDTISPAELPPDRLPVLLSWHEQDPVSVWERHRNAAIYARQGNRNPFIDHPEWAARAESQGTVVIGQRRTASARAVGARRRTPCRQSAWRGPPGLAELAVDPEASSERGDGPSGPGCASSHRTTDVRQRAVSGGSQTAMAKEAVASYPVGACGTGYRFPNGRQHSPCTPA